MFVDEATIEVRAGDGGKGAVSFYRAKYVPKGGPDGGQGGDGGSVIAVADANVNTLLDFRHHRLWKAASGEDGRGRQQYGAGASSLEIPMPPGTMIFDASSGELVADLKPGDRVVIARGGKGGRGNEAFSTPTHQAPTEAEPGEAGEKRMLRLELRLIADVGLVGLPNAGKSTLLSAVTRATPKIANYPFTTLSPQLGIAELDPERRLVVADLPGLIEGAAEGAGLGHEFLRHIERTRVIVHVVEMAPSDGSEPAENYRVIRGELERYSRELAEKREIVVLSKADLAGDEAEAKSLAASIRGALGLPAHERMLVISSAERRGLRELLETCWQAVREETGGAAAPRVGIE
ncbi:MAG: GTPase ObgE [Planctomycetota bacterium]|nr:GTPase ObgE [Planctomycetota bacterium]